MIDRSCGTTPRINKKIVIEKNENSKAFLNEKVSKEVQTNFEIIEKVNLCIKFFKICSNVSSSRIGESRLDVSPLVKISIREAFKQFFLIKIFFSLYLSNTKNTQLPYSQLAL